MLLKRVDVDYPVLLGKGEKSKIIERGRDGRERKGEDSNWLSPRGGRNHPSI